MVHVMADLTKVHPLRLILWLVIAGAMSIFQTDRHEYEWIIFSLTLPKTIESIFSEITAL